MELASTSTQTPIEIALGIDKDGYTTARALYEFLSGEKSNFSRWAKKNIEQNEYFDENVDWWGFVTVTSGNECKDYRLTMDFAKHLSMESHSVKGKIARQYFLKVEEKLKETACRVPMTVPEQIQLLAMGNVELNQKVDNLDKKIEQLEYDLPILGIEIDKITTAVKKKGVQCLGGKNSNAYQDKSLRGKVYNDIYRELKRQFGVSTYKAIKRSQCDTAVGIITEYQLPYVLVEQVQLQNGQLGLWGSTGN
ncbi:ORF6C domain-containing protein [Eubacterium ramulus]